MKLKLFQKKAANKIYEFVRKHLESQAFGRENSIKQMLLQAPTGSGKTLIMSKVINLIKTHHEFHQSKKISFIWLTLSAGQLDKQTLNNLKKYQNWHGNSLKIKKLKKAIHDEDPSDHADINIITWEKINRKSNEWNTNFKLKEKNIQYLKNKKIIVILDEEHRGKHIKNHELILQTFNPILILRTSATPITNNDIEIHEEYVISEQDAIEAQLIRKKFIENYGMNQIEYFEIANIFLKKIYKSDPKIDSKEWCAINWLLVEKGLQKKNDLKKRYQKLNRNINPLMIIQFPHSTNDLFVKVQKHIKEKLHKNNFKVENELLIMHTSEEKTDYLIEELSKNDHPAEILITKEAIVNGWDCPRAQILIKIRNESAGVLDKQMLGRIRRVPEPDIGYYQDDVLNNSYIYTWDKKLLLKAKNDWDMNKFWAYRHIKEINNLEKKRNIFLNQNAKKWTGTYIDIKWSDYIKAVSKK